MALLYSNCMSKSIVIDATHYQANQVTGVESYVSSLLPRLTVALQKKGVAVSWIGHDLQPPVFLPKGVRWIASPHKRFWSQTGLLASLKTENPDLFFTPSGLAPLRYKGKTAITVHDMAAYAFPAAFSFGQRIRLKSLIKRNALHASVILTPSAYTAKQVRAHWHIAARRLAVTPLALPESSAAGPEPLSSVDEKLPFFVYAGRIERKKNLIPLIKGFAKLFQENYCQLVLAGKLGFGSGEIISLIESLPPETRSHIILPGYISDGQKAWLFQNASAVAVPCMVEGFGLPVLEAFAAKAPLLCAKAGSLPEVAGDGAWYVKGDDHDEWCAEMRKLLNSDEEVSHRVQKGSLQLKKFDWDDTTDKTAEALFAVLG